MQRQKWWRGVAAVGFVVAMGSVPRGHTPISSRWNFNEHVYPVFKERCGSCHIDAALRRMGRYTETASSLWSFSSSASSAALTAA